MEHGEAGTKKTIGKTPKASRTPTQEHQPQPDNNEYKVMTTKANDRTKQNPSSSFPRIIWLWWREKQARLWGDIHNHGEVRWPFGPPSFNLNLAD